MTVPGPTITRRTLLAAPLLRAACAHTPSAPHQDATACGARHVPVRACQGAADTVVPLAEQQARINALRACGGRAQFTVYPGVGHDAWSPACDEAELLP